MPASIIDIGALSSRSSPGGAISVPFSATAAGGMFLMVTIVRDTTSGAPNATTPAGWSAVTNRSNSDGGGNRWMTSVFKKTSTGSESGSVSVSTTGNGIQTGIGFMIRLANANYLDSGATDPIDVATGGGSLASGTSISRGADTDNVKLVTNDVLLTFILDVIVGGGPRSMSGAMLTETGITFAVVTEHVDADDGNGENYGLYSALVTAGPGDNIPLFTATSTGSGTHITTAVFLRLREVSSSMDPMGLMGIFGI